MGNAMAGRQTECQDAHARATWRAGFFSVHAGFPNHTVAMRMAHRPGHSFESDVRRAIRKATSRRRCQSTHAPTAFLCGYACKGFAQDVRAIGFAVMVFPWDFTPIHAIADPLHARADKADVSRVRTIVIPARDAPTRLPDFFKRRNAGGVRYPYGGKLWMLAFPHAGAT